MKKFLSICLCVLLLFALVGCGKDAPEKETVQGGVSESKAKTSLAEIYGLDTNQVKNFQIYDKLVYEGQKAEECRISFDAELSDGVTFSYSGRYYFRYYEDSGWQCYDGEGFEYEWSLSQNVQDQLISDAQDAIWAECISQNNNKPDLQFDSISGDMLDSTKEQEICVRFIYGDENKRDALARYLYKGSEFELESVKI